MRLTSIFKRRENPRDDFARRIMARLQERGWPHEMTYDAKRFAVNLGDGGGGVMHLENTYREWLRFPEAEREGALDAAVAHVLEDKAPLGFEQAQDLLLPAIRNRFDAESVGRADEASRRVASAPVAGHLAVLVAIDREHSLSMVSGAQVAEWGVSFDSLLERAVANLESRSPCRFERHEGGFFVSDFGDYYDASRLLLPGLFQQLELKGDPVAVAVSRTDLVVTGSEETQHLIAMAKFVNEAVLSETRPISYAPLVWRGGAWDLFEPHEPALASVRELAAKQRLWDYQKQLNALEEEKSGREVFVAKAEGRYDGDELQTWSTWTKDVPTLLPRTDYIGVTDLKLHIFRRWQDVEAVCGPFALEPGLYPPRYFVDRWPDASALARLKAEFAPPAWGPD